MRKNRDHFLGKDYWVNNIDFYKQPYFRLEKCANLVNSLAHGRPCDLLDVGCGPATLNQLLNDNIHYYGIDIAIPMPGPNFLEMDITANEIEFGNLLFDLIVAAGIFEYVGEYQHQKLAEISKILKQNGKFITTYTNFAHIHPPLHEPTYNNLISIREFKDDLETIFHIDRFFPSSHNWIRQEPRRSWLKKINMLVNINIPIFSPRLANNYFFICSQK